MINFDQIPYSDPDFAATPGRAAEQWHDKNLINIPVEGVNTPRSDVYWRFTWARIEKSQGVYDWTYLRGLLNTAIQKKQKVTIGIMSVYHDNEDGVINYDGYNSSYPEYLHDLMQGEVNKDWHNGDGWIPNYNSTHYLSRLRALNTSLNNLLETESNGGVKYKDVINSIDVRGYGNYGEWHNGGLVDLVSEIPSAAHATTTTLKAIIDAHTQTIPNFQLSIIMTAFDGNWLQHTRTSPEVGYYALTTRNNFGPLGWRRDNWGATDNYIKDLLVNNNRTWNGVTLSSLIMNTYKTAPITGEPMNTAPNDYGDMEPQVRLYKATSFGNGNIFNTITTALKSNIRAASKASGYRLNLINGDALINGNIATIKTTWQNVGIAPIYDKNWRTVLEFVDGSGGVKHTAPSQFEPRLFLPQTTGTLISDVVTLPSVVTPGTYTVRVNIKDVTGYMAPLPIATKGKNSDGSYTIGTIVVGTVTPPPPPPPVNVPPVVTVDANEATTLPVDSVTLQGSATDSDGNIVSLLWSQVSGPSAATVANPASGTTIVSGLKAGTYVFRLTATDDDAAKSSKDVTVVVTPAPVVVNKPPVANAGTDRKIYLPVNSTILDGSASFDPDGQPLKTYGWRKVYGPTATITDANKAIAKVTNMEKGIYLFELRVTDDKGVMGTTGLDTVAFIVEDPAGTVPQKSVSSVVIRYDNGTEEILNK